MPLVVNTDKWILHNEDLGGDPRYLGYKNATYNDQIMIEELVVTDLGNTKVHRFWQGSGDYDTAWADRANKTYTTYQAPD